MIFMVGNDRVFISLDNVDCFWFKKRCACQLSLSIPLYYLIIQSGKSLGPFSCVWARQLLFDIFHSNGSHIEAIHATLWGDFQCAKIPACFSSDIIFFSNYIPKHKSLRENLCIQMVDSFVLMGLDIENSRLVNATICRIY